jgi:hypothetical protein
MKSLKKKDTAKIRGVASIAATGISVLKRPSNPEGRADLVRGTTLEAVLADLQHVVDKLGHFPSRLEYKEHGKCFHTMMVRLHGLQGLAKKLGMIGPLPGPKRKKDKTLAEFRCFNMALCVNTPPTKVPAKQTYCRQCKIYRGWGTFRGEYND